MTRKKFPNPTGPTFKPKISADLRMDANNYVAEMNTTLKSRKNRIFIILAAIGIPIAITGAVATPLILLNRDSVATLVTQTNSNWRKFVAEKQIANMPIDEAQFVIDQQKEEWNSWVEAVDENGELIENLDANVKDIEVIQDSNQEQKNTDNLTFKFNVVYEEANEQAEIQTSLGNGIDVFWEDSNVAKTTIQKMLQEIPTSNINEMTKTADLQEYINLHAATLLPLLTIDQEQVMDLTFKIEKVNQADQFFYNFTPIVTLSNNYFASQQPFVISNLEFKELDVEYNIEWKSTALRNMQLLINSSKSEITNVTELDSFLKSEVKNVKTFLTHNEKVDSISFLVKKGLIEADEQLYTVEVILEPIANTTIVDRILQMEGIKLNQKQIVNVNWDVGYVWDFFNYNSQITNMEKLIEWLNLESSIPTIKSWFTNNHFIEEVQIEVIGNGPFTLTPKLTLANNLINEANIDNIENVVISGDLMLIDKAVIQTTIDAVGSINSKKSLNDWLQNSSNQRIIQSWFTNGTNAHINASVQGQGPFEISFNADIKAGFIGELNQDLVKDIYIPNDVNWVDTAAVEQFIRGSEFIVDQKSLASWLADEANQPILRSWFTNNENVHISISATLSPNNGFVFTPQLNFMPGFKNRTEILAIPHIFIGTKIEWVNVEEIKSTIENNPDIHDKTSLQNWLNDTNNQSIVLSWFTTSNHANIRLVVEGDGPYTIFPEIEMASGFINLANPMPIANIILS